MNGDRQVTSITARIVFDDGYQITLIADEPYRTEVTLGHSGDEFGPADPAILQPLAGMTARSVRIEFQAGNLANPVRTEYGPAPETVTVRRDDLRMAMAAIAGAAAPGAAEMAIGRLNQASW